MENKERVLKKRQHQFGNKIYGQVSQGGKKENAQFVYSYKPICFLRQPLVHCCFKVEIHRCGVTAYFAHDVFMKKTEHMETRLKTSFSLMGVFTEYFRILREWCKQTINLII